MQYVLIIHEVADYPAWKQVFDDAAGIRKEAGERAYQVLKFETQPNKIVHFSAWTSLADAKAFNRAVPDMGAHWHYNADKDRIRSGIIQ
ncbi:MAG: antibiotic biosynthesis monooxygenase [Luteolibacter sp.]